MNYENRLKEIDGLKRRSTNIVHSHKRRLSN
jgi:hypothetical protein